jgi:glycosyltransferase involved in cell wall biosynthesis
MSNGRPPLRIALVANTSWYLYNFRSNLIRALQADGHRVFTIGGDGHYAARLRAEGAEHRDVVFDASGMNPLRELATVWALRRVLARECIDLVLSFTPKGNIYSALALTGRHGAVVMNVSGLGASLAHSGPLALLVRWLYRATLRRADWVFFQNDDDLQEFQSRRLVGMSRVSRLPGSGVDLMAFRPSEPGRRRDAGTGSLFLMVARMLWDKGVGEFVEAARRVKAQCPDARFRLLGAQMSGHRGGVPEALLRRWVDEGVVEYAGSVDDVRAHLEEANCVVLPSTYREGIPRSLLEAAASAKPVITTDWAGCRDAVDDGITGLLCRPRDPEDLARQMLRMLAMPATERRKMGEAGRSKMEREFDETRVIESYRQRVAAISLRDARK